MAKYTEQQKKEILSRIDDKKISGNLSTFGKVIDRSEENAESNFSGILKNNITIEDEVKSLTEPVKAIAKAGLNFSGAVSSGLVNVAKKLGVYEKYMYSKEDVLQEAKNISIETGIPESAILDNAKNLDNAREVYNYRRKQMALTAPGENDFSMEEVFERFPGLKEIAEGSTTDAAIALHNIENVKKVKSVVEAAKVGWNADKLQQKLVNIGRKGMYGEGLVKEDYAEAESIRKQVSELSDMPSLFEDPAIAIVGGVSQQAGLQLRGIREGMREGTIFGTAGALLGGAIGTATTGSIGARAMAIAGGRLGAAWGARLGFAQNMLEESAALRFLEYSEFKDKNGKKVLTDNEARAYAVASAAVETGIEFANVDQILKTLSGIKGTSADVLKDIIKSSVDTGTLRKGLQTFLNAGKIAASESLEEGVQEVADRAISTAAAKYWKPEGNIPSYTGAEMLEGGITNTIEALPASIGFGILAQGGSNIGLLRRAARVARINNEAVKETMRNNNGFGMLERLRSDANVQEFMKKAPDVAEKVMKANLEGSGFETINVDTELAMQEEGTHQILKQMAQKAGITEEELNAAIETQSSIAIPTEIYYQTVIQSPLADTFKKYISFSDVVPSEARSKYYSDMLADDMKALYEKDVQKQAELIDNILKTNFTEGMERDAAAFIITQYPNNPKAGWQEERRTLQEKYDAIINPALKLLEHGMKQGVEVIRPNGEGRGYRESRNAPWYKSFYAQNKRPPTQAELRQIAYEVVTGTGTVLPGWENNSPEAAEGLALNKEALDSLRTEIETLDAIKDKIDTLSAAEIAITKGLSKEGYKVYKAVGEALKQSPTKGTKRVGRANAIILARHADRIAEIMRESGLSDYTALDYFNERIGIEFGGKQKVNAFQQASKFIVKLTGDEFGKYRDIRELRSKAVDYYRKNLQGTTVYNPVLGEIRLGKGMSQNDLAFTKKGRDKMKISSAKADKLLSVRYLREIIEGAKFITEADGGNGKHDDEHFYYLHSTLDVNGEEKYVIATIKENSEQQLIYYNHNVFEPVEYKKIEDALNEALGTGDTSSSQNPQKASSFTDSISGKGNVYKQQRLYYQTAFHGSPSYNQKVNREDPLGQIDITEGGNRIISLFENANESTFAHESGHLFLADLKELAEIENAPEWVKKDWETIKEWLDWKEGQEGLTVEQHEKFADTFLEYLRSGEAPALSLKSIFRKFKSWLSALYKDIIGAGVKPSAKIKAIMDRMIATQEEIDEVMLLDRVNEFQKKGGMKGLSARSEKMYLRWLEEARQEAYEKTLQEAMQDITDKEAANKKEFLVQMRQSITEELKQESVFVAEKFVKENPGLLNNWPTEVFKLTLEEYKQQLEDAGGSLETAIDRRMEVEQKLAEKAALDEATIREQAERAVIENKYKTRYLAFEEEALQARRREELNSSREMKTAQNKVQQQIEKNKKVSQGLRVYRDNVLTKTNAIRDYAKGIMSDMSIQEATNPTKWRNFEKRAGIESTKALAKKDWNDAIKMKTMQRIYAELAALAQRNKDNINKTIERAVKRQKSINKNNHVPVDERYIFNHGLYVLGITPRDAMQPSEGRSLGQMLADYAANNEAFFVDENGVIDLPGWVISALEGTGRYKRGYQSLTVDEFNGFMDLLDTIYKLGVDANKIKTMTDANGYTRSLSEICEQIIFEGRQNVPLSGKQLNRIGSPGIIEQAALLKDEALIEITKPETILDELGKAAHRYIYGPIDQAANKRRVMDKESIEKVSKLFSVYSKAERNNMRKLKKYRFGDELLTKEEIICMALNWGTEINRRRIMDGYKISAEQVEELLGNLDNRDWKLVTGIWELVNSYWSDTVAVEERMTGTAPIKEEASAFVINGNDGEVYTLSGGYYPISYDSKKSIAASDQQQVDAVKMQMPNNAVLGRRRGFTKARSKSVVSRPIKLSFDVLSSHLDDVIHNICYRESVRDVNRILNNKGVVELIQERYGIETVKMLQQWARDNWAQDKRAKSKYEKIGAFFRRNQVTAAIGYRVVTAALGALNTTMMIEDIGFAGTLKAMKNFYTRPKEQAEFVFAKSSFMNQRAETMDRDQNDALKNSNPITKHAFDVMTLVDFSMSLPLWLSEYQRIYQEMVGVDADVSIVEREAVSAADKAVRKIFGSGDIKDLAPIQKGSELQKNLSMYYSFFNILYQRLHIANMKRRRAKIRGEELKAQLAPLAKTILFSLVMPGATEQLIRSMFDDDDDDAVTVFLKMLRGVGDYTVGMIPVIRDVYSTAMKLIFDGKYYSSRPLPIYDALDGVMKTVQSIKSDRQDWIDTSRLGLRSTAGAIKGVPYVLTDALTTTMRWVDDDFDQDFYEYIKAVVLDKKLE